MLDEEEEYVVRNLLFKYTNTRRETFLPIQTVDDFSKYRHTGQNPCFFNQWWRWMEHACLVLQMLNPILLLLLNTYCCYC